MYVIFLTEPAVINLTALGVFYYNVLKFKWLSKQIYVQKQQSSVKICHISLKKLGSTDLCN